MHTWNTEQMHKEVDMNTLSLTPVTANNHNLSCVYSDYMLLLLRGFHVCYLKHIKEISVHTCMHTTTYKKI